MNAEHSVEHNFPYAAAGSTWRVPEYHLVRLPDGTLGVSEAEINRIHLAIANHLCGEIRLTHDEMEFLADVMEYEEEALEHCAGIDVRPYPRWLGQRAIRWYVWFHLFGDALEVEAVAFAFLADPNVFLRYARDRAVDLGVVDKIERVDL